MARRFVSLCAPRQVPPSRLGAWAASADRCNAGAWRATAASSCGGVGGQRRGYHVAIVGSGPSAFYTAKYLFKQAPAGTGVGVDMFERLPTPFGLVRFGVAPDHPEVKNVIHDFDQVASTEGFRFFGNVELGVHVSLEALREHYDAVVLCTGAQGERLLNIPGEHLQGVVGAPHFVQWYNGHPDHVALRPQRPGSAAAVIGQGNVALDIARILTRSPEELHATDIHGAALAQIAAWQRDGLQTVHVIGRRGFIQAAFTNKELRELDTYDDVLPIVDPAELALSRNAASEQELSKSRMKKRSVDILEKMARNFADRGTTSKRIVHLRFLSSPCEVLPSEDGSSVGGLRIHRNELQGEPGQQAAVRSSGGEAEDIACGMVVRSVGFDITPMEGLPLDGRKRVPHKQGRVEDAAGGLYVAGWVKRGPTGIIASNIADAQETAGRLLADLSSRGGDPPARAGPSEVEAAVRASGTRVVSYEDWRRLEAEERRRGEADGKSAAKITDVGEMLRLL